MENFKFTQTAEEIQALLDKLAALPTKEELDAANHFVQWEGVATVVDPEEQTMAYSIPDHTYTELLEIMESGKIILLSVYYNDKILAQYFSSYGPLYRCFIGGQYVNIPGLVPEQFNVMALGAKAGNDDTIQLTSYEKKL